MIFGVMVHERRVVNPGVWPLLSFAFTSAPKGNVVFGKFKVMGASQVERGIAAIVLGPHVCTQGDKVLRDWEGSRRMERRRSVLGFRGNVGSFGNQESGGFNRTRLMERRSALTCFPRGCQHLAQ